jgi:hypothetical protein
VLKVVEKDTKHICQHVENMDSHIPVTTLTVVDGDAKLVLVKVVSQLNDMSDAVNVDDLVEILSHQLLYFSMLDI